MGWGWFVGARNGRFGHIGGNVGYQATLVMFADAGEGAVIMTNSDVGRAAGNALLDRIAQVSWVGLHGATAPIKGLKMLGPSTFEKPEIRFCVYSEGGLR